MTSLPIKIRATEATGRPVTRIFNEHGIQVSHSKVYQIQVQRDDLEAGRPNTRVIRPLPKQAQFHAVGKRGERYL